MKREETNGAGRAHRFPCLVNRDADEGFVRAFVSRDGRAVVLTVTIGGEPRPARRIRLEHEALDIHLDELGTLVLHIVRERPVMNMKTKTLALPPPCDQNVIPLLASVLSGENEFEVGQPWPNRWHSRMRMLHRTAVSRWISWDFEFAVAEEFGQHLLGLRERFIPAPDAED